MTHAAIHTSPATLRQLRETDPATLRQWLDLGQAVLVDVREADEYARERIDGAVSMPMSRLDPRAIAAEDGRRLVLHCRSGGRSVQAGQRVLASGGAAGAELWHLRGGIEAWKAAGLPTVVNRRAPLPIMQQVQIAAGALVLAGVALGTLASPWFLIISGFVGGGLLFAGASGWCGMAVLLQRMPWNRQGD